VLPFQLLPTCLPRCPSQPLLSLCIPLFPACSLFSVHILCRRSFSVFFFSLPIAFCISSFPLCALFPWVIATCTLILPWLLPAKNKHNIVVDSKILRTGHMESVRSFASSSPGSNIHLWHQCMGSNHPGDVRSEICLLFPQVML